MGERYLGEMAEVCRRTGFPVIEVEGWQSRARGSGGYSDGQPSHIMIHHTASGPGSDGWPDVNYCTFGDEDAPLCNLYLDRAGTIYVCAGGATNTNGTGSDPCGATADDSMNSSAIGIEAGNNGVGERWPDAMLDSYALVCIVLCDAYGIPPERIHAHAEWAPSRKTDPAGPDRYATGADTWDMDAFRADVAIPNGEDDTVTDDDIERIAQRSAALVWEAAVRNAVSGEDQPARSMLTWAHAEANGAHADTTKLLKEVGP